MLSKQPPAKPTCSVQGGRGEVAAQPSLSLKDFYLECPHILCTVQSERFLLRMSTTDAKQKTIYGKPWTKTCTRSPGTMHGQGESPAENSVLLILFRTEVYG